MNFAVECLTPTVGMTISGLDLRQPMSSETQGMLRSMLHAGGVVVIPDQAAMSRSDHVRLADVFGRPAKSPVGQEGEPCVVRVVHDAEFPPTENIWHADMSFLADPPAGAVLRAVELPPSGGDTLFADIGAVWEGLPVEVKSVCRRASAAHDIAKWLTGEPADAAREISPVRLHPVVRRHPVTGREVLWVNPAYTTAVAGMVTEDSNFLLEYLFQRVTIPEVQCRVRWREGTVVVWDNCRVQHYACGDYVPHRRVMERVSIEGTPVEAAHADAGTVPAAAIT